MTRHGPAVLGYALVTALYTWPLIGHVGTLVPRDLGDPLLSTWTLWWNATVLPFSPAWWNGPIFWPASGTLAFSDHRVGLALLTTPLQWAGVSPLGAYDVAFLATFVLCGLGVYALGLVLTGNRAAAFIGGLVFAFHPARAAHLEHLELLATYWLPVVFACLHRWQASRRWPWLAAASMALTLLAFTSGYVFVFGTVMVGGWVCWFARGAPRRDLAHLLLALAAPLVAVGPVLWTMRGIHDAYGFRRAITEIEQLSADLLDFAAAPELLAWWPGTTAGVHPERALYPGIVAVVLVVWAACRAPRATDAGRAVRLLRRCSLGMAALGGLLTLASLLGAESLALGPLRVSFRLAYKPFSFVVLGVALWLLVSDRVRRAWQRQSAGAFYALATVGLWILALGPTARVAGARVIYKAPYAWLMALPGFATGFRAPARFALVASFALAVAVTIVIARWRPATRGLAAVGWCALGLLLLGDAWIRPLPLLAPPAPLVIPDVVEAGVPILELPLGVYADAATMWRAMTHRHPVLNGLSGYEPPHYTVLRQALAEGDVAALAPLGGPRGIVAFVEATPAGAALRGALAAAPFAAALPSTPTHALYRLAPWNADLDLAGGPPAPVAAARATGGDAAAAVDGDASTAWSREVQRGDESLELALASTATVGGVSLLQGAWCVGYPLSLAVDLSADGIEWEPAWHGPTAARAVAGALSSPRECRVTVTFPPRQVRHVRLRQTGATPRAWTVADVEVLAARPR